MQRAIITGIFSRPHWENKEIVLAGARAFTLRGTHREEYAAYVYDDRKKNARAVGDASRRGLESRKKERKKERKRKESSSSNFFPPFDIVSLYLVRLPYFYFSPYGEQPVLDIFLRRVLARTSYLSMWKQPRRNESKKERRERERSWKNIKGRRTVRG